MTIKVGMATGRIRTRFLRAVFTQHGHNIGVMAVNDLTDPEL